MKMVISPGDRVRVTQVLKGYERGYYAGTVLTWTESGKLKIRADAGTVAIVSSELVKKIADGAV
ncbi:hypothetical protein [Spirosoma radiotolerans]|uniref:Uncharacterized protein n=1 Tax=Spirosoma radiotolerans TaxID=1379870 RepID=A0A0E3ZSA1_9BACT|nr:hypothetical protein [Spirosoma radiotolerans]AKD54035.1 hypothetical protein SD10_03065 [Spirosoma radiotolerans]